MRIAIARRSTLLTSDIETLKNNFDFDISEQFIIINDIDKQIERELKAWSPWFEFVNF